MDSLFPSLPKDLAALSDEELDNLLAEHEEAAGLISADDAEFLQGMSGDEIIAQYRAGAEQIKAINAEKAGRVEAHENYLAEKARIDAEIKGEPAEAEAEGEDEPKDEAEVEPEEEAEPEAEEKAEVVAEAETVTAEAAKEPELVTASAEEEVKPEEPRRLRRPPAPAPERVVVSEPKDLTFVASGVLPSTPPGEPLPDTGAIVKAFQSMATALGKPNKRSGGTEDRFQVAKLDYSPLYPEERKLHRSDWEANAEKIRAVGNSFLGRQGREALVASGGLCAPLEPIYSMPQFAVADRPVRDALPSYAVERGGVNVPAPTTVGDAAGAITVIEESDDALGGTYATKACLDMECPEFTEVAVTIISHCREYGNLNAMAWPEKIAHENELTMAAHARTAESYLLDRIKSLSVNVTSGAETLGALIYVIDAIVKARFGIISRLRMAPESRFRALLPFWLPDLLQLDTVQTQFGRLASEEDLVAYLRSADIEPAFYIDSPNTGEVQIAVADQTAGTLDDMPDTMQWAIFPEGAFLHIAMPDLNLGLVRDSTLNSTNDFQIFGESFENVVRIAPAQAAYWVTTDLCANGQFPPLGTARTCDAGVTPLIG